MHVFKLISALNFQLQTIVPKCPQNYGMVQQENGGCVCECLELVTCAGNKEWDRDLCSCRCDLMCSEGETLDEGECECRPTPTQTPRGQCTERDTNNPRSQGADCSSYTTARECRKHRCVWTRNNGNGAQG